MKIELKRKKIATTLISITILCMLISSMSTKVSGAEYVPPDITVTYPNTITPTEPIDFVFEIVWDRSRDRIVGNVFVYYDVNIPITETKYRQFKPSDSNAIEISYRLVIDNLDDGDIVNFKVWFEWGGFVGIIGNVESDVCTVKVFEEGFKKDFNEFWMEWQWVIIGCGGALIVFAFVAYKVKRRKKGNPCK